MTELHFNIETVRFSLATELPTMPQGPSVQIFGLLKFFFAFLFEINPK